MRPDPSPKIVDYDECYGHAFARLNREWLEKYFRVEPIDAKVLDNPRDSVIRDGGVILYLLTGDVVAGTVALKYQGKGIYELTKMAVTDGYQGQGFGRLLLRAVIDRYQDLGGNCLYLESHSSLTAALTLYESAGFCHEAPPSPSDYERADVYMVYRPEAAETGK